MNTEESIRMTKQGFEQSFNESSYYDKQTADDEHLKFLLSCVNPQKDDTIVDLGTGKGYIAFPLAEEYKTANIIGLDIVTDTILRNEKKAIQNHIFNLKFMDYDGMKFPFSDNSTDIMITRYALHHFPDIQKSFREMYRILKPNGKLIISDPTPCESDKNKFVDSYMRLKSDGHIKFYSLQEFDEMLTVVGFEFVSNKTTTITFPRKKTEECIKLLSEADSTVISDYKIKTADKEVFITEPVLNMVFRKENN